MIAMFKTVISFFHSSMHIGIARIWNKVNALKGTTLMGKDQMQMTNVEILLKFR